MFGLLARRIGYFARNDVIYEERGPNSWFANELNKEIDFKANVKLSTTHVPHHSVKKYSIVLAN